MGMKPPRSDSPGPPNLSGMAAPSLLAASILAWAVLTGVDLRRDHPISATGGARLPDGLELPVPHFVQSDPLWATDPLGPTDGTLAAEGCAIASAAMALAFHGADTDPGRLNRALSATPGGYTPRGWVYWEKAAEAIGAHAAHAYEGPPRHRLIDRNLARGNPVIARVRLPSGTTHFVVISGKREAEYLIRDPGARHIPRLSEFASPLEAIRFYLPAPPGLTQ